MKTEAATGAMRPRAQGAGLPAWLEEEAEGVSVAPLTLDFGLWPPEQRRGGWLCKPLAAALLAAAVGNAAPGLATLFLRTVGVCSQRSGLPVCAAVRPGSPAPSGHGRGRAGPCPPLLLTYPGQPLLGSGECGVWLPLPTLGPVSKTTVVSTWKPHPPQQTLPHHLESHLPPEISKSMAQPCSPTSPRPRQANGWAMGSVSCPHTWPNLRHGHNQPGPGPCSEPGRGPVAGPTHAAQWLS